jgi:hypothetical protein
MYICKKLILIMKKINLNLGIIALLLVSLTFFSCEKEEMPEEPVLVLIAQMKVRMHRGKQILEILKM